MSETGDAVVIKLSTLYNNMRCNYRVYVAYAS